MTNISSNNISAYSLDTDTGVTTALEKSPFAAGTRPVSATVDSTGTFLYVCNQSSKNITKFQINARYWWTSQQFGGHNTGTWLRRSLVFAK